MPRQQKRDQQGVEAYRHDLGGTYPNAGIRVEDDDEGGDRNHRTSPAAEGGEHRQRYRRTPPPHAEVFLRVLQQHRKRKVDVAREKRSDCRPQRSVNDCPGASPRLFYQVQEQRQDHHGDNEREDGKHCHEPVEDLHARRTPEANRPVRRKNDHHESEDLDEERGDVKEYARERVDEVHHRLAVDLVVGQPHAEEKRENVDGQKKDAVARKRGEHIEGEKLGDPARDVEVGDRKLLLRQDRDSRRLEDERRNHADGNDQRRDAGNRKDVFKEQRPKSAFLAKLEDGDGDREKQDRHQRVTPDANHDMLEPCQRVHETLGFGRNDPEHDPEDRTDKKPDPNLHWDIVMGKEGKGQATRRCQAGQRHLNPFCVIVYP